jgi:hypothetical protein
MFSEAYCRPLVQHDIVGDSERTAKTESIMCMQRAYAGVSYSIAKRIFVVS